MIWRRPDSSLVVSTQACRFLSSSTAGSTSAEISASGRCTTRAVRPARSAARTKRSGVSPSSATGKPATSAVDDQGLPSSAVTCTRQSSNASNRRTAAVGTSQDSASAAAVIVGMCVLDAACQVRGGVLRARYVANATHSESAVTNRAWKRSAGSASESARAAERHAGRAAPAAFHDAHLQAFAGAQQGEPQHGGRRRETRCRAA